MGKALKVNRGGGGKKYFTLKDCVFHEIGKNSHNSITLPVGVTWGDIAEFYFAFHTLDGDVNSYFLLVDIKRNGSLEGRFASGSSFVLTPNSTDSEIEVSNAAYYSASTQSMQCAIILK